MTIRAFQGEYRFLSNFYPAEIQYVDITYPTSEHAYQAMKTIDPNERLHISILPTPGQAKRAGQRLTLRTNWEELKLSIMLEVVDQKFQQNPELQDLLISTGTAGIEEGNDWGDTFWGVDLKTGIGQNWLGKILMMVRSGLYQPWQGWL